MNREFISVTEAARRMGVKRGWIARLCQQGRIPDAQKIGTVWIIPVGARITPAPKRTPGPPLRVTEIPRKETPT